MKMNMKKILLILIIFTPILAFAQPSKKFSQIRLNTDSTNTELNIETETLFGGIALFNNSNNSYCNSLSYRKSRAGATIQDRDLISASIGLFYNGTIMDTGFVNVVKVVDVLNGYARWRVWCNNGDSAMANGGDRGITLYKDNFGINNANPLQVLDVVGLIVSDSSQICTSSQTIASAATIYPVNTQNISITGTADISTINKDNIEDYTIIYILFKGNAATNGVVDGGNLKLAGDFLYTVDDTLILQRIGDDFFEFSRSIN